MGNITEIQFNGPYQKMYTTLFNAITDALNMMEDQDFAAARLALAAAQRNAEEIFLNWGK